MTQTSKPFGPAQLLRWTAGLLILSTVIFVAGVMLERGTGPVEAHPAAQPLVAAAPTEGHTETTGESQEAHPTAAPAEGHTETTGESQEAHPTAAPAASAAKSGSGETGQEQSEAVLGINFENPWIVGAFAALSLILAAALFRFGRPALLAVILVAGVATLLDGREIVIQLGRAYPLIAVVAVVVALAHAATALLAFITWRALGRAA